MRPERWDQIQALYLRALDRPAPERDAFVAAGSHGDDDLRCEVTSLLAAAGSPDPLLDGTFDDLLPLLVDAGPRDAAPVRAGPYRIVSELGRGGMATVFRAERDDDAYRREVALKVVMGASADASYAVRFRREQQILARLEHDNVARMYEAGVDADGRPWIAMELVEGEPIHRWCDARRVGIAGRIRLFEQVCAAVDYAHRSLVVHRDLKPSNILVTPDGRVKLLDFGIAKLLVDESVDDDEPLTRLHHRVLTPEYASPEQLRGEALTTASDVFSLGVVLHQLLTGRYPLRGDGDAPVTAPSTLATAEEGARDAGRRAAARATDPAGLRRQLQGEVDLILLKAMRLEPVERYPSAAALLEDLVRWREGRPVLARAPTLGYRARKFVGRNRVAAAGVTTIVLLVASGGVALALQQAETARERDRAQTEAERATQVTDFLLEVLSSNDPGEARGDSITVRQVLDRAAARVELELGDQPVLQARLLSTMGNVYRNIGLIEEGRLLLERSLGLYQERVEDPLATAEVMNYLANAAGDLGDYDVAERLYVDGLAIRERELAAPHADLSASLQNLGLLYSNLSRPAQAEPLLRRAVDMDRALMVGDTSGALGYSLNSLAILRYTQGDLDEAANLLTESLEIRRGTYGPLHPRVATTLGNLAAILATTGDFERADPVLRETLEMNRRLHGAKHQDVANSLHNVASNLQGLGRLDEAEAMAREALAMNRELLGEEHAEVAMNLNLLGLLARDRGDHGRAVALFDEAIAMNERVLSPTHFRTAIFYHNRAEAHALVGACALAESDLRHAIGVYVASQGGRSYRSAGAESDLAACMTRDGRFEEAEELLLDAYAYLTEDRGRDASATVEARDRLRSLYESWGRPQDAARYVPSGSGG